MIVCLGFVLWHRHVCFHASHTLLYAICLECPEGLRKGGKRGGGAGGGAYRKEGAAVLEHLMLVQQR